MIAVIDGAGAPDEFNFDVGSSTDAGAGLELFADGTATVFDSDGEPVAFVPAPWAYDANGDEVPSWYTLNGENKLVLNVDHSATDAYPVIADPKFTSSWWGRTIKLSSFEYGLLRDALRLSSPTATIAALICGTGAGCIAIAVIAAIAAFSLVVLDRCSNDKGVDIHYRGRAIWCSGY